MDRTSNYTEYAPAKRADDRSIKELNNFFTSQQSTIDITNSLSQMLVVLNEHRQIIYANELFRDLLNIESEDEYLGKRPGEVFRCIHAAETSGGCGTTEFCKTCGAVSAILKAQKGTKSVKECRIAVENNEAFDLQVTATPFRLEKKQFTIFVINDVSNEKRRTVLERLFFHDVMNSAGGIWGLSGLMNECEDLEEIYSFAEMINQSADTLLSEIRQQRQLTAAENDNLELNIEEIESASILKQVLGLYTKHEVTGDKKIIISEEGEPFSIDTDPVLLRRILGNMTKNALEASESNGFVTLSAFQKGKKSIFSVHNNSYMEREVQLQVFNRSFSTKGKGRGIGTYSIKLFSEKYLKGKVYFDSSRKKGTTFYLELNNEFNP